MLIINFEWPLQFQKLSLLKQFSCTFKESYSYSTSPLSYMNHIYGNYTLQKMGQFQWNTPENFF